MSRFYGSLCSHPDEFWSLAWRKWMFRITSEQGSTTTDNLSSIPSLPGDLVGFRELFANEACTNFGDAGIVFVAARSLTGRLARWWSAYRWNALRSVVCDQFFLQYRDARHFTRYLRFCAHNVMWLEIAAELWCSNFTNFVLLCSVLVMDMSSFGRFHP